MAGKSDCMGLGLDERKGEVRRGSYDWTILPTCLILRLSMYLNIQLLVPWVFSRRMPCSAERR